MNKRIIVWKVGMESDEEAGLADNASERLEESIL